MNRVLLAVFLMVLAWSLDAHAVRYRRPYNPGARVTAHFDEDRRSGVMRDQICGSHTYDNHNGTDLGVSFTDILAPADATITQTAQGCADYGALGNQCNSGCGNFVRMRFDDGHVALFCHMKNGSIVVSTGQRVSCGQKLGVSASSGNSTGPHLHFGWYRGGSALTSTYAGNCSTSPGAWTQQLGFYDSPGTACEVVCECSPGQVQTQGCGRCGAQQRVCEGNCRWGGWSGCGGEGPCSPGQVEEVGCCDCGRTRRFCNGACQWDGWSACAGPDPAGSPSCDTGLLGDCKTGVQRCVQGCLQCARTVQPSDELCDGRDNDCDGPVDEGSPSKLGSPPPAYAATIIEAFFPQQLSSDVEDTAWILFRNVGSEPWMAGEAWLRADAPAAGIESHFAPSRGWASYDVAAVLDQDVAPGEVARFVFPVSLSDAPIGEESAETFSLIVGSGVPIACPEGSVAVTVASVAPRDVDGGARPEKQVALKTAVPGCSQLPVSALGLLALLVFRRWRF